MLEGSCEDSDQGFTMAVIGKKSHWQCGNEKTGYQRVQEPGWVICKNVEST